MNAEAVKFMRIPGYGTMPKAPGSVPTTAAERFWLQQSEQSSY